MAYQRGSLRIVSRKGGDVWMLRYRLNTADGSRKENTLPVGLLRDFRLRRLPGARWIGLGCSFASTVKNLLRASASNTLAEYYLKADFGDDAVRPKSVNTIPIVEHYVRDYLIARWGNELAGDIGPLEIQRWLKSLHTDNGLAWTTVSKIRGIMHRVYKVGILHERVDKNPVEHVETRSQSLYKAVVITPQQTLAILNKLTNPAALHAGLDLRRHGASRIGDRLAALVGHPVERRANPHIEAMGKGGGRRDQDGGLERLCADASGTGGISEGMARAKSIFEGR